MGCGRELLPGYPLAARAKLCSIVPRGTAFGYCRDGGGGGGGAPPPPPHTHILPHCVRQGHEDVLVAHISCHGTPNGLRLEGHATYAGETVPGLDLESSFASPATSSLRLVFLMACNSKGVGEGLLKRWRRKDPPLHVVATFVEVCVHAFALARVYLYTRVSMSVCMRMMKIAVFACECVFSLCSAFFRFMCYTSGVPPRPSPVVGTLLHFVTGEQHVGNFFFHSVLHGAVRGPDCPEGMSGASLHPPPQLLHLPFVQRRHT